MDRNARWVILFLAEYSFLHSYSSIPVTIVVFYLDTSRFIFVGWDEENMSSPQLLLKSFVHRPVFIVVMARSLSFRYCLILFYLLKTFFLLCYQNWKYVRRVGRHGNILIHFCFFFVCFDESTKDRSVSVLACGALLLFLN